MSAGFYLILRFQHAALFLECALADAKDALDSLA